MSHQYDAIIIGSGIGGLTAGAFLAKAGMRVLVLEQHSKIGGYAHHFKRKNFMFESGIHSVPMGPNGFIMHLLRLLDIESKIEAIECPEMYTIEYPGFSMSMPSRRDDIFEMLRAQFPSQHGAIKKLSEEIDRFYANIVLPQFHFETNFVPQNTPFVSQFHNKSYQEFLGTIISDPSMRNLFYGQWPYTGAAPNYGSMLYFFMMFDVHCIEGSHYCKGGFSELAAVLASVITERGGLVKTRVRVTQLDTQGKKIRCVKTVQGEEFESRIVVSNISPDLIHNTLLPEESRGGLWQKRISNLRPSISSVIAYLGMKKGFETVVPAHIHFWYDSPDFGSIFNRILHDKKSETIDHLIALKTMETATNPTLTLMNFVTKSFSNDWHTDKMLIAEKMVEKADRLWPGLKEKIELMEVGSPTTFERYTLNTAGALYGYENTKSMYGEAKMPFHTHLDNLFQTGHWGKPGGGVWNVMSNAYTATKIILQKF